MAMIVWFCYVNTQFVVVHYAFGSGVENHECKMITKTIAKEHKKKLLCASENAKAV
jgi:hypothetical protein